MSDKPQKRSISIAGHATSISLEAQFWTALREIAKAQDKGVAELIAEIDALPRDASLFSYPRLCAELVSGVGFHCLLKPKNLARIEDIVRVEGGFDLAHQGDAARAELLF